LNFLFKYFFLDLIFKIFLTFLDLSEKDRINPAFAVTKELASINGCPKLFCSAYRTSNECVKYHIAALYTNNFIYYFIGKTKSTKGDQICGLFD